MSFTFLSWNINGRDWRANARVLPEYFQCLSSPFAGDEGTHPADVVALQEVRRATFELLKGSGLFSWHHFSLDEEGAVGNWGCALLGSDKFKVVSHRLLPFEEEPETGGKFSNQTLVVELTSPATGDLTTASFHVPNGSSHGINKGDFKRKFGDSVAAWSVAAPTPLVFGIDANSPEVDHLDPDRVLLFRSDSEQLFGRARRHSLKDVYLDHRRSHADESAAVSYHGNRRTPARFDHVWASKDVGVRQVLYGRLSQGSKKCMYLYASNGSDILSDHAWVAAELELTSGRGRKEES